MIDISSACVSRVIVHKVGNKLRDEGYIFSKLEANRTATLDDLLLKSYLSPIIHQGDIYDFYHESDISLNTVCHFSTLIFENQEKFNDYTQSIAKHLYSASTHPNIGGGEFISILFKKIITESGVEQALGVFKIEGKSDYLEVAEERGTLNITECLGISLDRIQKGAIILSESKKIYVIDSLGQKTKYWLDSFLKAVPNKTSSVCAKAAGSFIKAISNKVTVPNNSLEFTKSIQKALEDNESLSIGEIKEISEKHLDKDTVNGVLNGISGKAGLDIGDDLSINSEKLKKYTNTVIKRTPITEGLSLIIQNKNIHVSSINIKQHNNGLKAVIDIKYLENTYE